MELHTPTLKGVMIAMHDVFCIEIHTPTLKGVMTALHDYFSALKFIPLP
jgi:hypothetical protein